MQQSEKGEAPIDPRQASVIARLKALHEISMELSRVRDVPELCKLAVQLGHERLGFDRLGIWFIDSAHPGYSVGTWSIDGSGELVDERGSRVKRDPISALPGYLEGAVPIHVFAGEGGRAGEKGGRAVASLWNGERMLGEISADNQASGRGFDESDREILVLLARTVAHLTALKLVEAELRLLASTDALTGAVNRRTALIILEKQLGICGRSPAPLALCVADLDGLKAVNDSMGHHAGDEYIKLACSAMIDAVRSSDTVGRLGGDEFLVVFPDCSIGEARAIMARVDAVLDESARGLPYRPSLSWGLASAEELERDPGCDESADLGRRVEALVELADRRMYERKRGKGRDGSR